MLRPCIVAGPLATMIVRNLPWRRSLAVLDRAWRALPGLAALHPVLPNPCVTLRDLA